MVERTEVTFDSHGVACAATFYSPSTGTSAGGAPCVVMAHGFTGTRNLGLTAFAERFADAGMAVLVFDYAYFGDSGGQPRQLLDISHQLADYRAALAYVRSRPDIDGDRIALWGTSLSGGHVITVAARDDRVAAVVAQVPFGGVDLKRRGDRSTATTLKLLGAALEDEVRSLLHKSPRLVKAIGEPGEVAAFTDPHDKAIMDRLASAAPEWRNAVAARMLFPLIRYRPLADAGRLSMPVLVCLAERDTAASPRLAAELAQRAPRGELRRYPISHFDAYVSEWIETLAMDQIHFLTANLKLAPASP